MQTGYNDSKNYLKGHGRRKSLNIEMMEGRSQYSNKSIFNYIDQRKYKEAEEIYNKKDTSIEEDKAKIINLNIQFMGKLI